jgi:hypothetical protein
MQETKTPNHKLNYRPPVAGRKLKYNINNTRFVGLDVCATGTRLFEFFPEFFDL